MATVQEKVKPSMEEMIQMFKALGTPGEAHKLLQKLAGNWATRSKAWTEPGKPPEESAGTSKMAMIFGGRYLHQEETGTMMGMPYNGMGITGYDNNTKKYFTAWIDSMSTGIFLFEGAASVDGKVLTVENRFNDPLRGPITYRAVTTFMNEDNHLFQMYSIDAGGKEEKRMEMAYTRSE